MMTKESKTLYHIIRKYGNNPLESNRRTDSFDLFQCTAIQVDLVYLTDLRLDRKPEACAYFSLIS